MNKYLHVKLFILFFLLVIGNVDAQGSKKWFENNPFKNHYFVENKGQNRDFSHREDMYRNPQGLNENLKRLKEIIDSNF